MSVQYTDMSDQFAHAIQTRHKGLKESVLNFLRLNPAQPAEVKPEDDYGFNSDCLILRKDLSTGDYNLMTIYSNRYRDRDAAAFPSLGGEIVSSSAHEKFMAYLDENPDKAPELWSLHIPGTARKNRAHWWDFDGAFAYAEFNLTPEEAKGVHDFAAVYEPGLSHGFAVYRYDAKNGIIDEYETYEISILPNEWAANQWTTFALIRKEFEDNMKLTEARRAALVKLHGEDFVTNLETKGDELVAFLDTLGVDSKGIFAEKEDAEAGTEENQEGQEEQQVTAPALTEQSIVAALNTLYQAISAEIKAMDEKLNARIEKIEKGDDERVNAKAAAMTPSVLSSWKPASAVGQDRTIVSYNDALFKKEPVQAKGDSNHVLAGLLDFGGSDE